MLPANTRCSFDDWVDVVATEIEREAGRRSVFVLGESMGAGTALEVGRRRPDVAGLVLVSPATGWDRTALGGARRRLIRLPEPLLAFIIALSSYQLLDLDQFRTTVRRVFSGERSTMLEGPREAYAWRAASNSTTIWPGPEGIHVAAAATTRPVVISTQVARRLGAAGATRAARGGLPPPHGRVGRRVDQSGLRGGARGAARAFVDRRLLRGNQRILTGTMRFGYCAGRRYRGPASSRGGGGAAHRKAGSRTVPTTRPPRHRRGPRRRNGRPAGPAGGDGGVAERGRWQLTCI